ncbi:MotA/TolQ/ExbB proton channel family protein [Rugosibacter aromaticivorans]|uniref:MotA/TolQ/ExbB proton channel family protein n=1 Tax=Rugosibacter aromaticivorans TaxID=1565605 RepID=UPI000A702E6F|nr:MotA/TolQ/ExbB proton channel family protein [Rugosibacter aromaticivorans]
MENSLGFAHFLANSDGIARFILVLMTLMSIGTWYLILAKSARRIAIRRKSNTFLKSFWVANSLNDIADEIRANNPTRGITEPFADLVQRGIAAVEYCKADNISQNPQGLIDFGTPGEFLIRSIRHVIAQHKAHMEYGNTYLATVASSAPFVGLFGTVWGIYHALLAIGMSGQSTLDKVAGPVGEALIMTAIGLAVAIPAAVAYNTFTRANRNALGELNAFAHELFTLLATGLKTVPQGSKGNEANHPANHAAGPKNVLAVA